MVLSSWICEFRKEARKSLFFDEVNAIISSLLRIFSHDYVVQILLFSTPRAHKNCFTEEVKSFYHLLFRIEFEKDKLFQMESFLLNHPPSFFGFFENSEIIDSSFSKIMNNLVF